MKEQWADIFGFESRYQVSNSGRVKALSFMQRFVHGTTGEEHFRRTKERFLATQEINSGYLIVHLHLNNKRTALLVHRLVATAFCFGGFPGADVNHKDGIKTNNSVDNLEWVTRTRNHLHAVHHRLNLQAVPVVDPTDGTRYDSIAQAAKLKHRRAGSIAAGFIRADELDEIL